MKFPSIFGVNTTFGSTVKAPGTPGATQFGQQLQTDAVSSYSTIISGQTALPAGMGNTALGSLVEAGKEQVPQSPPTKVPLIDTVYVETGGPSSTYPVIAPIELLIIASILIVAIVAVYRFVK